MEILPTTKRMAVVKQELIFFDKNLWFDNPACFPFNVPSESVALIKPHFKKDCSIKEDTFVLRDNAGFVSFRYQSTF